MNRIFVALLSLVVAAPAAAAPLRVLAWETPPFLYRQDGKPAGVEVDILEYYAKAKGQTLEVIFVEQFDDILPRLERGEADVAAGTLTITAERQQRFDWSASHFPVRVMLVERQGQQTASLQALAGATLATMRGTTYERILSAVPNVKLVYGADEEELFRLVSSGQARAAAADSALILPALRRYPQLRMGIPLSQEQGFGFAVRKGSPLAAELSKHIQQLKGSQIYFRLLEKHLGTEAARLVAAGRAN
jgi:ABC-type amino acid transport substrate-binding protein